MNLAKRLECGVFTAAFPIDPRLATRTNPWLHVFKLLILGHEISPGLLSSSGNNSRWSIANRQIDYHRDDFDFGLS